MGGTPGARLASVGGTAGSSPFTVGGADFDTGVTQSLVMFEMTPAAGVSWDAGNWTVNVNVTTAANVTWVATYICRLNSSDVSQGTIGSLTGQTTALGTTGVKTHVVSGSAQSPGAGDKVYVVCVFTSNLNNRTVGITPSELISSPFTAPTAFTATAALTTGGATFDAAATFAPGTKTATAALTAGGATFDAAATFTAPVYDATAAPTTGGVTFSASATFAAAGGEHPVGILTQPKYGLWSRRYSSFADKGSATYTATAALTTGGATATASATFTAPVYSATAALTTGGTEFASSGTFTAPVYTATVAPTAGGVTFAASGSFAAGGEHPVGVLTQPKYGLWSRRYGSFASKGSTTYTATASLTAGGATFAASASFTAPVYTATASLTTGGATLAASGTVTAPVYSATAALTTGGATFAGSASFATVVRQATAALTTGGTEFAASATFTAPVYDATASLTTGGVTFAGSGTVTNPVYSATAALTTGGAEFAASAAFAAAIRTATAAVTTGGATLAASATFAPGTKTATATLTTGGASGSAAATMTAPVYTATAAVTAGGVEFDASALFGETELTSDLWAYYRFHNNLRDASGNDRHLTTDLGATYQAGIFNRALATEGGSTTTVPAGTLATHDYSISVWMHATHAAAGNGATVGWDRFYLRHIEPGGSIHYVQFVGEGMAGSFPGQATLVHDAWNHVVVTWNHSTQRRKIYVNGVLADDDLEPTPGTSAFTQTFADATDDFSSGLDGAGLYTRELSSFEAEALYNDGDGFDPTAVDRNVQPVALAGLLARLNLAGTLTRTALGS